MAANKPENVKPDQAPGGAQAVSTTGAPKPPADLEAPLHHQRTQQAQEVLAEPNKAKRILKIVGPGVITGASDDDPSGIATYTTVGASFGYATLWTALVSLPLMAAVQFICAKIALTTGKGLTVVLRERFPKWVLYPAVFALFAANTINAGTDIGAVAAAINLLLPIPILALVVPIAVLILALQVLGSYDLITKVFKWLALSLLAYIGAAFLAHPDTGEVVNGTLIPHFELTTKFIGAVVAILGTTISPYLFFWQASQEVEELPTEAQPASPASVKFAAWDIIAGMTLSNLVMYFIILATAATLFTAGQTDVSTATDAAKALEPIAGSASKFLLALGLIGGGLLAIPVLTGSSGYALAELFGWKHGLDRKPQQASEFYAVIVLATLLGILVNFSGISPFRALFFTAIINGLLAPPLLVLIMLVSDDPKVMGERANGTTIRILGWTTAAVMTVAAVAFMVTLRDQL